MQEHGRPEITIIMGVYEMADKEDMLRKSVQSILNQTMSDFEFLICADGSDKRIQELLREYQKQDNRIILLRQNKEYSTLAEKLNLCLSKARGNYIARQDADDISMEHRFERELAYLKSTSADFVGSDVYLYDRKGIYGQKLLPSVPNVEDFLYAQPYIHPTLMLRKEALQEVGGYAEEKMFDRCEDFDLLMRLYQHGYKGENVKEKLFHYYVDRERPVRVSYKYRINETYVRYINFKRSGLLPKAILYVIKPLVVGCIPNWLYKRLKKVDYRHE